MIYELIMASADIGRRTSLISRSDSIGRKTAATTTWRRRTASVENILTTTSPAIRNRSRIRKNPCATLSPRSARIGNGCRMSIWRVASSATICGARSQGAIWRRRSLNSPLPRLSWRRSPHSNSGEKGRESLPVMGRLRTRRASAGLRSDALAIRCQDEDVAQLCTSYEQRLASIASTTGPLVPKND